MGIRGGGDPYTHGPSKPTAAGPNSQGLPPKPATIWEFMQPGIVW
jgi:hypothetical protein